MNGAIFTYTHHDKRGVAAVEILADTDFALKTEIVEYFGKWVAMVAYGFNYSSWEQILRTDTNLGAAARLDELKKEIKEDIKVGQISILKFGHKDKLLEAAKKAMHCLTAEDEEMWMESQAWEEAPYHFLWKAITNGQPRIE